MDEILEQATAILREIWRYRWIALAVAWGVCLVAWPVVLTLPNRFEAQARVFVDPSTALKPVIQGIAIEQDVNAELNFVRQSLMSRPNLQKIVAETGLSPPGQTPEQKEKGIDALSQRIEIIAVGPTPAPGEAPAPSKVYTIKYQDTNRDRSLKVVKILLDSFMEGTIGGKRNDSLAAQKFVEGQIKDYEARLADAEQRLAEFKKTNVGMVPGATDQQSDYFTRLQNEIDAEKKAQTTLGIAQTRRAALEQQLRGEAPIAAAGGSVQSAGSGGVPGQGGDTLSRIQETQAKLDDLLLRFTDKHPDVIALRQTLEDLKARRAKELEALKNGDANAAATTGASSNPVYQSIQLALNQADVEIAGLRGEINDHRQKVADLRRMVDTMPQVEAEYARLNRDYNVNKAQYSALVERLQKARLGGDAEATGSVRFEILDPPAADLHPVAPQRTLLLLAVLGAALVAGAAIAYLLTRVRPVFHSAKQLGEITGIAVLGVVSANRDGVREALLRRQYLKYSVACSALIVALVLVVLVGRAFSPLSLSALHI
jgi:polysaccharide chain length determinant protein (PEP-CTERM system associated)